VPTRDDIQLAFLEKDAARVRAICDANPETIHEVDEFYGSTRLQEAIEIGALDLARYFVEAGVDINKADIKGDTALSKAVSNGDETVARWLIEQGAECTDECVITSVTFGGLSILKLLVQSGARTDFRFGALNHTPLSQARERGHEDIVDYLLSQGLADTKSDSAPPEDARIAELIRYVTYHVGQPESVAIHDILPSETPLSVHTVSRPTGPVLFTTGLSYVPFEGPEEYKYAELLMHLPKEWPVNPPLNDPRSWPMVWLQKIASWLLKPGVSSGAPLALFWNDSPPQPLDTSTEFAGFLLAFGRSLRSFKTEDGRNVNFITAIPVYPEELLLAKDRNIAALLTRFDQYGVGRELAPGRVNAAVAPHAP
jgi:hypothetical protein